MLPRPIVVPSCAILLAACATAPSAASFVEPVIVVRGTVFDPQGAPLPGVEIASQAEPRRVLGHSDEHGRFQLELPDDVFRKPGRGNFLQVAAGQPYGTVRGYVVRDGVSREDDAILVAAPILTVHGTVVSDAGSPIPRAVVRHEVRPLAMAGFPHPLDRTAPGMNSATTDSAGRFEIRVPAIRTAPLSVTAEGCRGAEVPLPLGADKLKVELEWNGPVFVSGTVRHPDGSPAPGAAVRLYLSKATADEAGRFRLEFPWRVTFERLLHEGKHVPLCAGLPGFQPALIEAFEERLVPWQDIDGVELFLPGPALSIAGRIPGADDWRLDLRDGTDLAPGSMPIYYAEHLSRKLWTAAGGLFRVDGLLPRTYVIEAWDEEHPVMVRSDPVPAGTTDLVLSLPPGARKPLAGRLVDVEGRPLAGVNLAIGLDIRVSIQGHHNSIEQPETVSAEDGTFAFPGSVPTTFAHLAISGEEIVPARMPVADIVDVKELVIPLARRSHVRFEVAPDVETIPDEIQLLDEAAEPLTIYLYDLGWRAYKQGETFELQHRSTPPLVVSEKARTLVVLRQGVELARLPVRPVPGQVVTVRYR